MKGKVYIGGADAALSAIKEQGVTEVFDLRDDGKAQEGFPDSHRYHYPIVENRNDQEESIKSAIQAVTEAVQEGKKVFFHCAVARNCTGTVATALLMNVGEATTVEEAEKLAIERRPEISIKPEMRNVLKNMFGA
ncbi:MULTISPECIES: protein-tyrosine phosphatase family protein [Paenibacillus]|uniref:Protein phosphatase Slingshot-like protein n=1 Tax=Paenibacillus illinoisensis TaxID=59845 RepID=A0A2W0C9G5_9BACL|nr:dual specificity protein phosphatase family protein [Paenibacillus illinoisensis]PYY27169.1 Protein phosphatase Slingshot-like protein [Paenibacillus illinoisensis]